MTTTTTLHPADPRVVPDERDEAILAERVKSFDARVDGPRVGDFVVFPDGTERRVSFLWDGWTTPVEVWAQTSDGGSYYLGSNGYVSMSGSLHPSVPCATLTLTDERRDGAVWFFHHDYATAHNAVGATIPFRVYRCSVEAPGRPLRRVPGVSTGPKT